MGGTIRCGGREKRVEIKGESEALGLSAGLVYRAGGHPGGEGFRMGISNSVVGNLDRHVDMSRGPFLTVGLELDRPVGLLGPDVGTVAPGSAPCPARCTVLFQQKQGSGSRLDLSLHVKKGS